MPPPARRRTSAWALSSISSVALVRLGFKATPRSAMIQTSVIGLPMITWAISSSSKWYACTRRLASQVASAMAALKLALRAAAEVKSSVMTRGSFGAWTVTAIGGEVLGGLLGRWFRPLFERSLRRSVALLARSSRAVPAGGAETVRPRSCSLPASIGRKVGLSSRSRRSSVRGS